MTYASEVLADSPYRYWKLDEASGSTAADSSGNGANIAYANAPTYRASGPGSNIPYAIEASGTDVCFTAGLKGFDSAASAISLEAWIYPTAVNFYVAGDRDSQFNDGFQAYIDGSQKLTVLRLNGGSGSWSDSVNFPLNTWTHLVLVMTGSELRVLYNGVYYGGTSSSVALPTWSANRSFRIGHHDNGSLALRGRIAQVATYNQALSDARAAAHYNAGIASAVAKADTDSFTFTESEALTTLTAKADTDSATFTETGESISALVAKADTDSFTAADTAILTYRTSLVATDLFRATELSFLNYSPTPPLNVKFLGHRVYAQLADADNLPAVPSPSRTFRMPTTTEDLDLYLLDENGDIIDPAGLTMTFDVGTPGVRAEGVDDDITAVPSGSGDPLVWITIPGGLLPGVYSCRLTVNTGTVESPVYRSYPTEPITLIVED